MLARLLTALVVATAATAGASRAQTGAPESPAIVALLDSQAAAWNRGDLRGYMSGYWNSDSLVFTSGGRVRRGWQATLEAYTASYGNPERMGTLSFSGVEVHILTPESAWVLGRWRLVRAADAPGGVFSLVLRKFGDRWKIVHDHTSSDPADRKDTSR